MSKGGNFRNRPVYFSQVSNEALRDNNLSLKAKGLYALIQSYITIQDFTLYKNFLKKQCLEGEKAFESTWKELKDNGYLIQFRFRDEDSKQFYYEYDLLDVKDIALAKTIHDSQNRKTKEEKGHTPKKEGMEEEEKSHTPKRHGMANVPNGKGGVYNNTNPNNTYIIEEEELFKKYSLLIANKIRKEYNLRSVTKTQKTLILEILKKYNNIELVNKALEIGLSKSAPNILGYMETLLEDWTSKGLENSSQIDSMIHNRKQNIKVKRNENEKKILKENKPVQKTNEKKPLRFSNYEQRDYDYDSLEWKLLGWGDKNKDKDNSEVI